MLGRSVTLLVQVPHSTHSGLKWAHGSHFQLQLHCGCIQCECQHRDVLQTVKRTQIMNEFTPINCNSTNYVKRQINKISALCSLRIKQYLIFLRKFSLLDTYFVLCSFSLVQKVMFRHKLAVTHYSSAIIFCLFEMMHNRSSVKKTWAPAVNTVSTCVCYSANIRFKWFMSFGASRWESRFPQWRG